MLSSPSCYTKVIAQIPSSINGMWPVQFTTKQIPWEVCRPWRAGKFHANIVGFFVRNFSPISRFLFRPLISIQLHCLPSSSETTKAVPHPSGVGVRLIYWHQSLFVWMSYGLTLLVCSFVGITKADTVTGELALNCHTATSLLKQDFQEVALYTANAPASQQTPPTVNLPIPPSLGLQNQTKIPQSQTSWGFYWQIWNMYFSLWTCLCIQCLSFWSNTSENPHFPLLEGTGGLEGLGEMLIVLWFFMQNPDLLWCVAKRTVQSKRQFPGLSCYTLVWFCPMSGRDFLSSLVSEKMCCGFPGSTYRKLSVKWQNHVNYEDQCIMIEICSSCRVWIWLFFLLFIQNALSQPEHRERLKLFTRTSELYTSTFSHIKVIKSDRKYSVNESCMDSGAGIMQNNVLMSVIDVHSQKPSVFNFVFVLH